MRVIVEVSHLTGGTASVVQMGFAIFPAALLVCLAYLLHAERREKRRLVFESCLPRELRLPRHYRGFTEVERRLWTAVQESGEKSCRDSAILILRTSEESLVQEYVHGLCEDFQRGNRIYVAIVRHAPAMSILASLVWPPLRIRFAFCFWYALVIVRLRIGKGSMPELRRLTDTVATLAYHVRMMLRVFERSGNSDFVEQVLKSA